MDYTPLTGSTPQKLRGWDARDVSSQELPRWSVPCQWIRPGSSSWTVQTAVQSGDELPELHDKHGGY